MFILTVLIGATIAGESIVVTTFSEVKDYGQFWLTTPDVTEVVFAVKACHSASIAMSEILTIVNYKTYELVLGAGTNHDEVIT